MSSISFDLRSLAGIPAVPIDLSSPISQPSIITEEEKANHQIYRFQHLLHSYQQLAAKPESSDEVVNHIRAREMKSLYRDLEAIAEKLPALQSALPLDPSDFVLR